MQWRKKNWERWRTRFAIFPVSIDGKWVWLEKYYVRHFVDHYDVWTQRSLTKWKDIPDYE